MGKTNPRPRFESWGRYPTLQADVVPLHWTTDYPLAKAPAARQLPVGLGRSYGDVCLLKDGNLLLTTGMDRLIDFDPENESVSYLLEAVSRPRHILARIGYPFSRAMQHRFARDSHARIRRAVLDS